MEPIVNFKSALDIFNLGRNYVVLCLDVECVAEAKAHDIIAYGGYIIQIEEGNDDWHYPVARMKVPPIFEGILSICSWPPTLIYSTVGTTFCWSMRTLISRGHDIHCQGCDRSTIQAGKSNFKAIDGTVKIQK